MKILIYIYIIRKMDNCLIKNVSWYIYILESSAVSVTPDKISNFNAQLKIEKDIP